MDGLRGLLVRESAKILIEIIMILSMRWFGDFNVYILRVLPGILREVKTTSNDYCPT